ncbi:hypothetical protein B0O99DRAFT_652252 [Bisporella sp. PMI_857]|nr:hypothetical protein B0O99DRAFT_652252 [Bisporella sp. PMI_857]
MSTRRRVMPLEILDWYPHFQSCRCYFLDHAQHSELVQAVAALINTALPFQKQPYPVLGSSSASSSSHSSHSGSVFSFLPAAATVAAEMERHQQRVSLRKPNVVPSPPDSNRLRYRPMLHSFFGDSWRAGIGPLHEIERRNYLFAAKSANWLEAREGYDIGEQTVPFLRPLQTATDSEIRRAEEEWSEWLAMQDWMVGERGIDVTRYGGGGGGGDIELRAGLRMGEEPEARVSRDEVGNEV